MVVDASGSFLRGGVVLAASGDFRAHRSILVQDLILSLNHESFL